MTAAPANSGPTTDDRLPLLFRPDEVRNLKWAIDHSGRDEKTVRRIIRHYGIGRQAFPGSWIEVHRIGFEMALAGDSAAIELLRAGRRDAPEVRRYYDFCGIRA